MNEKLQRELFDRFDFLHPKDYSSKTRFGGLACGDGWFDLIWNLCLEIETLEPSKDFEVIQVKSKFARLRFYARGANSYISEAIERAKKIAVITCERCGMRGETVKERHLPSNWLVILCSKCYAEELLKV